MKRSTIVTVILVGFLLLLFVYYDNLFGIIISSMSLGIWLKNLKDGLWIGEI